MLASTVLVGAAAIAMAAASPALAQGQPTSTPDSNAPPVAQTPVPAGVEPGAPIAPAPGAQAQLPAGAADASGAPANTSQAIVVTGSLIRSPNLTADAPVTAVSSKELKLEGTTQVEQTLNRLPQFTADQNQSVANGATGIATLSLRNLGATRTLVLVDGTRLQPGDPTSSAADVNNIPSALVDRIDVLTGGASATYGSDAIAGVVNFVLKKNFQGVQIDTQYGFYNHQQGSDVAQSALKNFGLNTPGSVGGDGQTWDTSILIGANSPDDKGNVTFYATYRNLQPVTQDTRDFSGCALGTLGDSFGCVGSSNSSYGRFDGTAASGFANGQPTFGAVNALGSPISLSLTNKPGGGNAFQQYSGAQSFNYGPYNFLQRADDRYNAGAFAHYKFSDKLEVYGNFMFTDDESFAQIAPSGLFRGTGPNGSSNFTINCDNPLLSAQQALALCGPGRAGVAGQNYSGTVGYRFLGLPRTDDLRHTDYRINVGARGDLGSGWNYDAYLQYGKSLLSENYQNDVSVSRVQDALLVGVDPATGQPACKSTIANGGKGACVPLNIFQAQSAGLTPAQIGYVVTPGFQEADVTEQIAHIQVSGDLGQYGVKSPLSPDGVGVAFGSEYRSERLNYRTDAEFVSGDLAGQGGPRIGTQGAYDVYELFGEANIPLVRDLPFVHDLSIDLAYRFSDYSTVGETNTYKASFSYSPVRDLRFRGGYNRAVRAPSVNELFDPVYVNLGSFTDPCSNEGQTPSSFAQCARTGLTQAQYNAGVPQCPAAQCSILIGGNSQLKQETADTYTLGFVYQPSWLRGFDVSIDAYDIAVSDLIGVIPPSTSVSQCLSTGNPFFCDFVHRDPNNGSLFGTQGYVVRTNLNTGVLQTKGVDVVANYTRRLADFGLPDYGSLSFNLIGTYVGEQRTKSLAGFQGYDCVGRYGVTCGQPTPRWKHELRATWNTPLNVAVSAQWRFVGQSLLDLYSANPNLTGDSEGAPFDDPIDRKIGAQSYLDLAVTWRIRDGLNFRGGVNNVLDNDPPVVDSGNIGISGPGGFGNGNTFPGVYDSLGRFIFMGVTADF